MLRQSAPPSSHSAQRRGAPMRHTHGSGLRASCRAWSIGSSCAWLRPSPALAMCRLSPAAIRAKGGNFGEGKGGPRQQGRKAACDGWWSRCPGRVPLRRVCWQRRSTGRQLGGLSRVLDLPARRAASSTQHAHPCAPLPWARRRASPGAGASSRPPRHARQTPASFPGPPPAPWPSLPAPGRAPLAVVATTQPGAQQGVARGGMRGSWHE